MLKFTHANGLRFAYIEQGTGPLVLLLHGFPDTAHTWDQVRPALAAAGFRAVSPFMRGYWPTEIPPNGPFDFDTLGRDALALIDALGEKKAIVVGHDFGASAAFSAVGLDSSKIRLLITAGIPHPAAFKFTPMMIWHGRHIIAHRFPWAESKIRARNMAHLDELVQRWSPGWKVPPEETAKIKETFRQPGSLKAALGYYRAIGPASAAQKRMIEVPAVAFAGITDNLEPAEYEVSRSRYVNSYEVIAVPGGHFMHREHPQPFIENLIRVLKPFSGSASGAA